jgi:hypothetical protein
MLLGYLRGACAMAMAIAVLGLGSASANPTFPRTPLTCRVQSIPEHAKPGPITLRVTIISNTDCGTVELEVTKLDNLSCTSPHIQTQALTRGDTVTFDLNVVVPTDDTSEIAFRYSACDYWDEPGSVSWVATADRVEFWEQNIRGSSTALEADRKQKQLYVRQVTDTLQLAADRQKYQSSGTVTIGPEFELQWESIPSGAKPGPIFFRSIVRPTFECDTVTLTITGVHNLTVEGSTSVSQPVVKGQSVYFDLSLIIPPGDTSVLAYSLSACNHRIPPGSFSWVADQNTVSFSLGDIRESMEAKERARKRLHVRRITDTLQLAADPDWREKYPNGKEVVGYYDKDSAFMVVREYPIVTDPRNEELRRREDEKYRLEDSLKQKSEKQRQEEYMRDSAWVQVRDDTGGTDFVRRALYLAKKPHYDSAADVAHMVDLEKGPLTDRDAQYITVNGKHFVRWKGETKFRPVEWTSDVAATVKREEDSIRALHKDQIYHVTLQLGKPEDYEFARSLVDTLLPTDTAGVYRASVTKDILGKIEKQGIRYRVTGYTDPATDSTR